MRPYNTPITHACHQTYETMMHAYGTIRRDALILVSVSNGDEAAALAHKITQLAYNSQVRISHVHMSSSVICSHVAMFTYVHHVPPSAQHPNFFA